MACVTQFWSRKGQPPPFRRLGHWTAVEWPFNVFNLQKNYDVLVLPPFKSWPKVSSTNYCKLSNLEGFTKLIHSMYLALKITLYFVAVWINSIVNKG